MCKNYPLVGSKHKKKLSRNVVNYINNSLLLHFSIFFFHFRGKDSCTDTTRENDKHNFRFASSSVSPRTFSLTVDTLEVNILATYLDILEMPILLSNLSKHANQLISTQLR